jgi:hypothetical protein
MNDYRFQASTHSPRATRSLCESQADNRSQQTHSSVTRPRWPGKRLPYEDDAACNREAEAHIESSECSEFGRRAAMRE